MKRTLFNALIIVIMLTMSACSLGIVPAQTAKSPDFVAVTFVSEWVHFKMYEAGLPLCDVPGMHTDKTYLRSPDGNLCISVVYASVIPSQNQILGWINGGMYLTNAQGLKAPLTLVKTYEGDTQVVLIFQEPKVGYRPQKIVFPGGEVQLPNFIPEPTETPTITPTPTATLTPTITPLGLPIQNASIVVDFYTGEIGFDLWYSPLVSINGDVKITPEPGKRLFDMGGEVIPFYGSGKVVTQEFLDDLSGKIYLLDSQGRIEKPIYTEQYPYGQKGWVWWVFSVPKDYVPVKLILPNDEVNLPLFPHN